MNPDAQQGDLFGGDGPEMLDLDGADVVIHRNHFDATEAKRFFEHLQDEVPWKQEETILFGKRVAIPRLTAWFGDQHGNYSYSGIKMTPHPWTTLIAEIRDRVGEIAVTKFNSVLLNLYRDGTDSVDWHADDEPELGSRPVRMSRKRSSQFPLALMADVMPAICTFTFPMVLSLMTNVSPLITRLTVNVSMLIDD